MEVTTLTREEIQKYQEHATYRPNLAELMWGYKNNAMAFIADLVCPWFMVPDVTGQYRVMDADSFFNIPDTKMNKRSAPNESTWGDSFSNYDLVPYGHAIFTADVDMQRAISQYGNIAKFHVANAEFLAHIMKLDREKRVLDMLTTYTNYASGHYTTLTGNDQWSALNTSNPRSDVLTGKLAIAKFGVDANTLIVDINTHFTLLKHPDIKSTISGGAKKSQRDNAIVDSEVIREYFQVESYIVSKVAYNTTSYSATPTQGFVMSDYAILAYVDPMAGGNDLLPTFCKTLVYAPQANIASGGWQVKTVRDERAGGSGGEYMQAWFYSEEKIIANRLGYLIQDTLA